LGDGRLAAALGDLPVSRGHLAAPRR
jgi:hypothetical protein